MKKLRVLQVADISVSSGVAHFVMNNYRYIDKEKLIFDFVVWRDYSSNTFENEILDNGGVIHRVTPYKSNPFKQYKEIVSIIKKNNYEVVHIHEGVAGIIALAAAKKCNVPARIFHSHTTGMDSALKNRIAHICAKYILKNSTKLLACSVEAGRYLFSNKADFKVVNNGIDINKCSFCQETRNQIRNEYNLTDEFLVGHIGRLSTEKNHTYILKVFSEILKIKPNSKLMLIGDGPLREQLEKEASELNISDNVIFTGIKANANSYLNAMDAFIFPSFHEGMPISLLEAQCNGLHCFASENINKTIDKTGQVNFISIGIEPIKWAEAILSKDYFIRESNKEDIINSCFTLDQTAKQLEEEYLLSK